MPNRIVVATALGVLLLAACTSRQPTQLSSTASVSVDSAKEDFHVVKCTQMDWTRMVYIGSDFSGAKVTIDEHPERPTAESVHIQNLGGFTGMYSRGGDGNADTSVAGEKFTITGTANGYKTDKPGEPATATFKITVEC